ncbi:MAG: PAS domain S-box protein [Nitrospirae bacterium]|nr:PAS domain S-box protein [Nitrospirota bacterium]
MDKSPKEARTQAKRILVAVDKGLAAVDLKSDLIKLGYEVPAVVDTAEEAVCKTAELLPDLIIMDIKLIGPLTGIEAADEIRKTYAIPVIYITANADVDSNEIARTTEPFGYLPTPCNLATLKSSIDIALYKGVAYSQRKKTEEALRKSEEHYRSLFNNMLNGCAYCRMIFDQERPVDFIYLDVNKAFESLTGLKNVIGKKVSEVIPGLRESDPELFEIYGRVASTGKPERIERYVVALKLWFAVSVYSTGKEYFVAIFDVITDRKRMEEEREITIRLMHLLNSRNNLHELMHSVIDLLKDWTGCEAIGIRLRDGEDFPYFETRGFPSSFIEQEKFLCERDLNGQIVRDSVGNPVLECMCGNILCRRFDPAKPFFTEHGSFRSNNTSALLASTTEADRQARTRNRCNGEGYESVALIPLRAQNIVFGLLQINDHRTDRFTPEGTALLEKLADNLAIALSQRYSQKALRVSEARLRTLLQTLPDLIWLKDPDGVYLSCNLMFERLYGAKEADIVGKTDYDFVDRDLADFFREHDRKAMVAGKPSSNEEWITFADDGHRAMVHTVKTPMYDDVGKLIGVLGIAHDITVRKKAEDEVRQGEAKYRHVINSSYDAVMIFAAESGRVIEVNKAAEVLYGYSAEEFLKLTHMDLTAEPDISAVAIGQALDEERVYVPMRMHRKKDGTPLPVEISASYFMHKGRKLICGCVRDITERMNAQMELLRSEEKFRNLFNNAEIGMFRSRLDGSEILDVNQKFLKITGRTLEESIGQPSVMLWADPREREKMVRMLYRYSYIEDFECQILNKRGEIRNCLTSLVLYLEQGIVEGSMLDITERKKLEEQLLQSQKMESIGTLAGGVAHDFNNILMTIVGYGNMVKKRVKDDEKLSEYIGEVLAGAQRASELTHSLLAFSRKQTIALKQMDLNEIVRNINKMLLRVIGEDINLTNLLINRELPVMADCGQIEQVLLNLATNARDAMPDGGELLLQTEIFDVDSSYADAYLMENTGLYAVLSVSDTGIGMDQEVRKNIFEPFFTTKEVGKGTGLGLAMVYGIIKQHGGHINVYSDPGQGTTFRVYLRMIALTDEVNTEKEQPVSLRGSETIFLAEDDPNVRKITRMYLQEYGYKVIEAENGVDAVTRFIENRDEIALVLLDVIMPGKNGREAYEEILKFKPDIKAAFMSGYTDDVISRKGILSDGFDFISKPINPEVLMRKIREILDR